MPKETYSDLILFALYCQDAAPKEGKNCSKHKGTGVPLEIKVYAVPELALIKDFKRSLSKGISRFWNYSA
jgi:hypothetical protein